MKHDLYVRRKNGTIIGLTARGKAVAAARLALDPPVQMSGKLEVLWSENLLREFGMAAVLDNLTKHSLSYADIPMPYADICTPMGLVASNEK